MEKDKKALTEKEILEGYVLSKVGKEIKKRKISNLRKGSIIIDSEGEETKIIDKIVF